MAPPLSAEPPLRAELEKAIGFQYEIIRLLGRGGMGAVYHAHERALDRPVAIKVLPPDAATTPEGRERFLREARTAARLTHPNIVPLFTFGEAAGLIYFVMGYVDGESLEQRLRRTGKLDPADASRILEQLAAALDYAHRQGVVHRDVKPDNVLLERETGNAMLTDFGIARRAAEGETLTGTGLLLGTPRYMSPEQAAGDRDIDTRSDIYALGLVGYAMLTGRPPFDGASVQEILTRRSQPRLPAPCANYPQRSRMPWETRWRRRASSNRPSMRWTPRSRRSRATQIQRSGSGLKAGSPRSVQRVRCGRCTSPSLHFSGALGSIGMSSPAVVPGTSNCSARSGSRCQRFGRSRQPTRWREPT